MPRLWPVNEIDETVAGQLVRVGPYVTSAKITEGASKSGKLMYTFVGKIQEHAEFLGVPLYENFVIGSDNDRDAEDPDTWKKSIGAGRMRQCLNSAGIPPNEDVDEMIANEFVVGVNVGHEITTNPNSGEKEPRNKVLSFFAVGNGAGAPRQQAAAPAPATTEPAKRGPGRPRKDETVVPAQVAKPAAAATGKVVDCGFGCGWKGPLTGLPAHVAQAHADDEE